MPIVVAVFATLVWYVWARLVRDPCWPRQRILTALYLVLVFLGVAVQSAGDPGERVHPLRLVLLLGFGAFLHAGVYLAGIGVARGVAAKARGGPGRTHEASPAIAIDRRRFLARVTAGGVGSAAVLTSLAGYRNVWDVTLPEVPVRLERLPRALDGFRIVQLSDLHVGGGGVLDAGFVARVVELVEQQRPDVVVVTGDLVEGRVAALADHLAPLAALVERRPVYYVSGNHEYYGDGGAAWSDVIARLGARVLLNERVSVGDPGPGGASFDLAGVPDRTGGRWLASHAPDVTGTLAHRDPERELVLLAHQPSQIDEVAGHEVGLQISGHTHGGQFFPIVALVHLVEAYVAGLHRHPDGTQLYVSRGTGFFGPAVRTLAPAEIPAIVLTS